MLQKIVRLDVNLTRTLFCSHTPPPQSTTVDCGGGVHRPSGHKTSLFRFLSLETLAYEEGGRLFLEAPVLKRKKRCHVHIFTLFSECARDKPPCFSPFSVDAKGKWALFSFYIPT